MRRRRDVLFYVPTVAPMLGSAGLAAAGAETQLVLLGRELARRGLRVAFVVYEAGLPPSVDGLDQVVQRPNTTRVPGLRSLEALLRTIATMVRANAPVVITRNASSVTVLVGLAARVTGRRFVFTSGSVVDFDFQRLEPSRLRVRLFRLAIRLANPLVVQTSEQVTLARERFRRDASLIRSIAEPAPPRRGTPRAFLWIGRLTAYKRPHAYLDLAAAVPEARFVMVGVRPDSGDARLAQEVAERARSLENVELAEPRPRSELGELYEQAVAVVSTSDFEGMPNVFLEGWARGVPALALHHDPDGLLVRERLGEFADGDPARFAALARTLWSQREGRPEEASRCIAYVRDHHSLDAAADAWMRVIRAPEGSGAHA